MHPKYVPGGKLIDVKVSTSVTQELGISCASLQNHYMDNLKKPKMEQASGIMVRFKPENFHHTNVCEFNVNWEDLYLMLNLQAFDLSIMRCLLL